MNTSLIAGAFDGLLRSLASSTALGAAALQQAASGDSGGAGASGVTASSHSVTILDYLHAGGILSYILLALSVVAVALVIRNLMMLRYRRFAPDPFMSAMHDTLNRGSIEEVRDQSSTPIIDCFLARVLKEAFSRSVLSTFGFMEFKTQVEEVAREEADEVHRANDGLAIIAAVAPMLGLLGTVIGMIGAFRTIGSLEGSARSNQLAMFMSMALVNTAEGLIVAIPCTVAYALFRRHTDRIMQRLGRDLERIASYVQLLATPGHSVAAAATAVQHGGSMARQQAPSATPAAVYQRGSA